MFKSQLLLYLSLFTLFACANIGPAPKGGKEDKTPPVLKVNESTPNLQTNFKKQDITLVFNEFVELKDVFNQVIVSPPLEKRWKLNKKLKTVTFEFHKDEVLRPDATYTINFGEAIRDFTAGNPVPDFRFVFSTGAYIDSMTVSGKVLDALTGEPAESVLLMLYDNLSDTVVRTERPFYFAKTDKSGAYKIENVKKDTFKIFALKDSDLNYLFNLESEMIGFPDSNFVLTKNEETIPPVLVFKEEVPLNLITPNNNQYGFLNLKFNQKPLNVDITYDDIGQQVYYETDQDSIKFWYHQEDTASWNLFVEQELTFKDTFLVIPRGKETFFKNTSLVWDNFRKTELINLNPTKPVKILFNHPLNQVDSTSVLLLEDTTLTPVIPTLKTEGKNLVVNYKWKEKVDYELQVLPGSVSDLYGLQNADTIRQKYRVMERKAFGDIKLTIVDLDPQQAYVINLYLKNNTNLVESLPVSEKRIFEKTFKTLPAGKYLVEIVTDQNGNGKWDSGNYDKKLQPEPFFSKPLEALREGWDLDAQVSAIQKGND